MKTRLSYLSLISAILVFSFSGVQTAEAKIRVRANIRTPNISVRVDTRPTTQGRVVVRRAPLPARYHTKYEVTKKDKKIAKRLSKYTGESKRELLRLRRQGYRWMEIGYWLDIPRPVVSAAQDSARWKRFLRYEQRDVRWSRYRDRNYDEPSVCYHD